MEDIKSPAKDPSGPRAERETETSYVRGAGNAASDTMVAVGDVLGATIHAAADVGEDVVHGVGRVAMTAVDETANVLTGIASGVRDVLSAGFSGRGHEEGTRHERRGAH